MIIFSGLIIHINVYFIIINLIYIYIIFHYCFILFHKRKLKQFNNAIKYKMKMIKKK